ncbi:phospholipid carrier-dependent glycosyltransferase [Coleofasciculus sp. FACHB-542]|uniref:glycosyltransferase family 39 protein n=1 Tax=Coleofasciculus sp. FACHB-542 TaxID=2692787 RepID=UPI0016839134|nr:phospholipid carrier-dependent glycosyltransferase [Coleofasciculus sp. FACHB-542]MBD2085839.1 phospholipid carrier-dependent glycosyltransferase [Coleofasciculus sp. FACHB-542]
MINNWLLLLVWIGVGTGLRLLNLAGKSPWTDEFSTLVFSLGNSFRGVPLDRAIALDTLLQPLQANPAAGINDVIHHLVTESNHPPLYFVLTHLWLKLFPPDGGLVSLWGARSLAALFGIVSIPAMYAFGWFAFRSRLVGHLAAAMMAVSPYGIFLAQEARHYTLAILWAIASLSCLVVSARHLQRQASLPIWLVLLWVGINTLGISSHYFFVLTLGAQALALIVLLWQQRRTQKNNFKFPTVKSSIPLLAVAAGTLAGGLVWVPVFLQNSYGGKLTEWIQGDRVGFAWLSPIFQAIAAWITMIVLLPVESPDLVVVILSGAVMIVFFLWALPILYRSLKFQRQEAGLTTQLFEGFIWSAIALFFVFTYILGIDLTRGARYNFVYFPAVIVIVGASLADCWNAVKAEETALKQSSPVSTNPGSKAKGKINPFIKISGQKAVALIWLMGLLSGLTVACNLGYQKYYRPDLLVPPIIELQDSPSSSVQVPILIATTHKTHVQNGEMMGIAWELKQQAVQPREIQFLLAHQDQNPQTSTAALQKTLATLPRPLDVLLVNFHAPIELDKCVTNANFPSVDGYETKLYYCRDR